MSLRNSVGFHQWKNSKNRISRPRDWVFQKSLYLFLFSENALVYFRTNSIMFHLKCQHFSEHEQFQRSIEQYPFSLDSTRVVLRNKGFLFIYVHTYTYVCQTGFCDVKNFECRFTWLYLLCTLRTYKILLLNYLLTYPTASYVMFLESLI